MPALNRSRLSSTTTQKIPPLTGEMNPRGTGKIQKAPYKKTIQQKRFFKLSLIFFKTIIYQKDKKRSI